MEYNVGDIVAYIYKPGIEFTIIDITDGIRAPPMVVLDDGTRVFDSQLTLIKAYQPEDKNNTTMLIVCVVIAYLFL